MNRPALSWAIPEETQLQDFAARFAARLRPPLVIYLAGALGAGKTTFVRALARALGYPGRVKSPTYGLLERYELQDFVLLHLDLYRIEDEAELDYLALRDQFGDDTVLLIEWPDRGGRGIPPADIELHFSGVVSERALTAEASSPEGERLLSGISR